jgi:hypothetical protein
MLDLDYLEMTGKKMKEIKNLMKIFLYTFEISSS